MIKPDWENAPAGATHFGAFCDYPLGRYCRVLDGKLIKYYSEITEKWYTPTIEMLDFWEELRPLKNLIERPKSEQIGIKHDGGKLHYSLLPFPALKKVAQVLEFGAKKYAPDNWKKVPNAKPRYFDAAMRHLIAHQSGELLDPESGLSHLSHAACCVLLLIFLEGEE